MLYTGQWRTWVCRWDRHTLQTDGRMHQTVTLPFPLWTRSIIKHAYDSIWTITTTRHERNCRDYCRMRGEEENDQTTSLYVDKLGRSSSAGARPWVSSDRPSLRAARSSNQLKDDLYTLLLSDDRIARLYGLLREFNPFTWLSRIDLSRLYWG